MVYHVGTLISFHSEIIYALVCSWKDSRLLETVTARGMK